MILFIFQKDTFIYLTLQCSAILHCTNRKEVPKNETLSQLVSLGKTEFRVAEKDDLTFYVWQGSKAVMSRYCVITIIPLK